jgi:hypothetical protein
MNRQILRKFRPVGSPKWSDFPLAETERAPLVSYPEEMLSHRARAKPDQHSKQWNSCPVAQGISAR